MQSNASTEAGNFSGNFSEQNLYTKYPTLVDLYKHFYPAILYVDRSVTPIWYLLGLFGNLLSAYVWMHPRVRRNNSSAVYLAALSVWDLAFLVLHSFQEVREAWNGITIDNPFVCSIITVPLLTAQYLSPVLVLCFTVERWIAIWFPFKRDSLCTPRRACIVTVAMTSALFLWNLFQLHFRRYNFETSTCDMQMDTVYWRVYTTATEVVFSGIVPVTALVFNLLVAKELHRITVGNKHIMPTGDGGDAGTERRFRATTVMLLCVSFFVILTSLPAGLMYALQNQDFGNTSFTDAQVMSDGTWQSYFRATLAKKVIDEVSISHYSLNFLIYLLTGPQYRTFARQLLGRLLRPLSSCRWCPSGGGGAADSAGQRREKLREQEQYYLANSRTDRARRRQLHSAANQTAARAPTASGELSSGGSQSEQGANGADAVEATKPLLKDTSV